MIRCRVTRSKEGGSWNPLTPSAYCLYHIEASQISYVVECQGQNEYFARPIYSHLQVRQTLAFMPTAYRIPAIPLEIVWCSLSAFTMFTTLLHSIQTDAMGLLELVFILQCRQDGMDFMMSATRQPLSRTTNYYISTSHGPETTKDTVSLHVHLYLSEVPPSGTRIDRPRLM